jgi:hypothetical protein
VEPIKRVASNADPCASPGVRSQRVPLPPLDAPVFGDATAEARNGHAI